MSFVGSGTTGTEAAQRFLEQLQNDFRTLSNETKKKNPQIKEVYEHFFALLSSPIRAKSCDQQLVRVYIDFPSLTSVAINYAFNHSLR